MSTSSENLHPENGARFVFARIANDGSPRYKVDVYLPVGIRLTTSIAWDDAGSPMIGDAVDDPWVLDEIHKLARVLKRDPRPGLTRWRGRNAPA